MTATARYDRIGVGYVVRRQPDPRIEARIWEAIGPAGQVLNVGAGTGSYERTGRTTAAVELSAVMIQQRPAAVAPAVRARAEQLPFADLAFDAAMALLTVHHWSDIALGLAELRRVARRQVVMTVDPPVHDAMWLVTEYVPAIRGMTDNVPLEWLAEQLGAHTIESIPIPGDCLDGFCMAYWNRPEHYLDPDARAATSAFARLDPSDYQPGLDRLAQDLASGAWHRRHADLLEMSACDIGLRLLIGDTPARD